MQYNSNYIMITESAKEDHLLWKSRENIFACLWHVDGNMLKELRIESVTRWWFVERVT